MYFLKSKPPLIRAQSQIHVTKIPLTLNKTSFGLYQAHQKFANFCI